MGLLELVRMILLLFLLLGTDTEPQGASLFNQDSIIELINLTFPEGRCLPGDDSTLHNSSAGTTRAPGLLAGLGKGQDQMEQDGVDWDLPCPLSSFLLWTHPLLLWTHPHVLVLASSVTGRLRISFPLSASGAQRGR